MQDKVRESVLENLLDALRVCSLDHISVTCDVTLVAVFTEISRNRSDPENR